MSIKNPESLAKKDISAEEAFDFEKFNLYQQKYHYETKLIYAGRKDEEFISGYLYLANVAIKTETNEICYIESTKDDEYSWFKKVSGVSLSSHLIEEKYHKDSIPNAIYYFKKRLLQHVDLLNADPFIAWELLEGGKNHHLYLEYINDSNNYLKIKDLQTCVDNLPYY